MKLQIVGILLLLAVTFCQTTADHEKLHSILSSALKDNEKATATLNKMKILIQTQSSESFQTSEEVVESIKLLHQLILQAQVSEDDQFALDTQDIYNKISAQEDGIQQTKANRQAHRDTIQALQDERQSIEDIYEADKSAYNRRVSQQNQIKLALSELIERSTQGLLENPDVAGVEPVEEAVAQSADSSNGEVEALQINNQKVLEITAHDSHQTNTLKPSDAAVFAQVRHIGHGKPIEALVQLSKIFTKTDAQALIDRFQALSNAVELTQSIDSQKEDYNLNLFNTLTNNIDNNLIPSNEAEIAALNSDIKTARQAISDLQDELQHVSDVYSFRKTERLNALNFANTARINLEQGSDSLSKSEAILRQK